MKPSPSRIYRIHVTALVLGCLCAGTVAAQSSTMEEVIVTGNKMVGNFGEKSGIPLQRMPQSVQVISGVEIANLGAVSVGDILRTVPGANPGYSRVGAWQSFSIKVRGFLADQIRNGMRQRYYEDVDASAISNIERIEVLKGPSGVLFGQSAVGGIVSIVTKRPQRDFAASGSVTVGSENQRVAAGDITGALGESVSARLTGEIERSDTFVDHQEMDRNNVGLSLTHTMGERMTGYLVTEYIERETSRYPGQPVNVVLLEQGVGELDDSINLGEPSFTDLDADAPLVQYWLDVALGQSWTVTPRLQYQEFNTTFGEIRLRDPEAGDPNLITRNGRHGQENDEYMIGQLDLNGEFDTGPVSHKLLVGYEHGRERGRFTQYNIVAGTLDPIDVTHPVYSYATREPELEFAFDSFYDTDTDAVYAQDQLAVTEALNLIAAIRYTDIEVTQGDWDQPGDDVPTDSTIWQLGGTYQINDLFSLYAGYNTGFDIESTSGARTRDGSPLEPEESEQSEVGLRVNTGDVRASVALFRVERTNALTTDPDDPDYSINAGEQQVDGVELEGDWNATENLSLSGGYAWLDDEITESNDGDQGERIGDVPEHNFNLHAQYRFTDSPWVARTGVMYTSSRALVNGSVIDIDEYTLWDLGVAYEQPSWSASLHLNNVLDEEYYTASGNRYVVLPGDPRAVSLRLSTRW